MNLVRCHSDFLFPVSTQADRPFFSFVNFCSLLATADFLSEQIQKRHRNSQRTEKFKNFDLQFLDFSRIKHFKIIFLDHHILSEMYILYFFCQTIIFLARII